jgi:hypothetical protein
VGAKSATGIGATEVLRYPDGSELHGCGHYFETYDESIEVSV